MANVVNDPYQQELKRRHLRLLKAKKAALGREDLFFFAKYILGYNEMEPQPHDGLCKFVSQSGFNRMLILEPRGCFKTSVVTVAYTMWRAIRNPNIRILIDSEDLNIAKTFLREIKGQFESNDEFRSLYGDHVGPKWTEGEIFLGSRTRKHLKEASFATSGVETTRVSQHYDLIIRDDLHSEQNIGTPEQIAKVKKHVALSYSLLDPGGDDITIGTRWHYADVYSEMLEKEAEGRKAGRGPKLRIRRKKAIYEDGRLHFPTRLTREFLDDVKWEQGSYVFSCQYQNEPVDEESATFKKKWLRYYGRDLPTDLVVTSTLDPAISEKDTSCYTSIVTVGTDLDGYIYLLDVFRERVNPTKVIDAIFMTYRKWKPVKFGIESVAMQKTLKYWAAERSMDLYEFPYIVELKTDTRVTKPMRIQALIPYVENGLLLFPGWSHDTVPGDMAALQEEMLQFPVGKYMDCIDALAYQLQLVSRPARKKAPPPREDTAYAMMMKHKKLLGITKKSKIPIIGHDRVRSAQATVR